LKKISKGEKIGNCSNYSFHLIISKKFNTPKKFFFSSSHKERENIKFYIYLKFLKIFYFLSCKLNGANASGTKIASPVLLSTFEEYIKVPSVPIT